MLKLRYKIGLVIIIVMALAPVGYGAINYFTDVSGNAWYSDSLYSLKEKGIVSGYNDGTFRPGNNVSRADLVVVIDNLIDYLENGDAENSSSIFEDPLSQANDINLPKSLALDVTFTAQAPKGDWSMPYQEACEEASLIMVEYYMRDTYLDSDTANNEILNLVEYENKHDYNVDIGVSHAAQIATDYYKRESFEYYGRDVTLENIKKLLVLGHPVIIPAAGLILDNPNYLDPGPEYHMIVIVGYDESGFITHDTGTSFGENYHYSYEVIEDAIHDWTGKKSTVEGGKRAILVFQ